MDLKEQERQKKLAEMQQLFKALLQSSPKMFDAGAGTVFMVDAGKQTLWSFGATGISSIIEVPLGEGSLVGWTAVHKKVLNIADAYQDSRFNSEADKKFGRR